MQHQAYLLQCLLAAALCSGASVASDSASELSDDCSGPESVSLYKRRLGAIISQSSIIRLIASLARRIGSGV